MADQVTDLQSFFADTLQTALSGREMEPAPRLAGYLVDLMLGFVAQPVAGVVPSGALAEAEALPPLERVRALRVLGDTVLFAQGFFQRAAVAPVLEMGADAYSAAAHLVRSGAAEEPNPRTLEGLADGFPAFCEVLGDVRELTALGVAVDSDPAALCSRFSDRPSPAVARRLAAVGAYPLWRRPDND